MPRSRFRSAVQRTGPKRATIWVSSSNETDFTSLPAASVVLDQSFSAANVSALGNFTITRTVGQILCAGDQVAALEVGFGAMGMTVVSAAALAAGIGSLPTPITDEASDQWFVYQSIMALTSNDAGSQAAGMKLFPFDSKAQRRVEDGQAIATTVENASATDGLIYLIKFRMLIKLH